MSYGLTLRGWVYLQRQLGWASQRGERRLRTKTERGLASPHGVFGRPSLMTVRMQLGCQELRLKLRPGSKAVPQRGTMWAGTMCNIKKAITARWWCTNLPYHGWTWRPDARSKRTSTRLVGRFSRWTHLPPSPTIWVWAPRTHTVEAKVPQSVLWPPHMHHCPYRKPNK